MNINFYVNYLSISNRTEGKWVKTELWLKSIVSVILKKRDSIGVSGARVQSAPELTSGDNHSKLVEVLMLGT